MTHPRLAPYDPLTPARQADHRRLDLRAAL